MSLFSGTNFSSCNNIIDIGDAEAFGASLISPGRSHLLQHVFCQLFPLVHLEDGPLDLFVAHLQPEETEEPTFEKIVQRMDSILAPGGFKLILNKQHRRKGWSCPDFGRIKRVLLRKIKYIWVKSTQYICKKEAQHFFNWQATGFYSDLNRNLEDEHCPELYPTVAESDLWTGTWRIKLGTGPGPSPFIHQGPELVALLPHWARITD